MNYSNHILDYSRYNYICLPKAGSQHLFRGLVVHIMDCLGNNNRIEWYRTKDVEPPEGTWLWTIEPAYKYNKKTGKLEEVLPKAIAPDRNS